MSPAARIPNRLPARRPLLMIGAVILVTLSGHTAWARAQTAAGAVTRALSAARGAVGWQSYRRLDLLPLVRQGVSTYQSSSYDPTNHNDDGYDGRYSCLHRVALGCVMAQHTGPGELESVWTAGNQQAQPGPSGDLIIQLDGRTVLDDTWPQITSGSPSAPFAFPLALASNESWGGSSIQVPMIFLRSMRVISQFNPHYYHVVYRTFTTGAGLPNSPTLNRHPAGVLSELRAAGTRDPKPSMGPARAVARRFRVRPGHQVTLARVNGTGAVTALRLQLLRYGLAAGQSTADAAKDVLEHARLRIVFDGVRTVDAPLGEFFGSGLGPAVVRSLMFAMDGSPTGWMSSWWPMPFAGHVRFVLVNTSHTTITNGQVQVTWARNAAWRTRLGPRGHFGYFYAWGHRGPTTPGRYWTFLRTKGSGTFQGVTLTMEGPGPYYMEGNERAYVDGARMAQIQGTGTEDFFDGGWYFFDQLFSLPLSGYTQHSTSADGCPTSTCKTAYRVMIADSVPFSRSVDYEIQHGPQNNIQAIYGSTAYWYERSLPRHQSP